MTSDRILITGGAGYVGSLLVPALLADDHSVTVYDMLWYGKGFLPTEEPRLTVVQVTFETRHCFERQWHTTMLLSILHVFPTTPVLNWTKTSQRQ